jgi:SAM-dependent MidA family methyltransferase
VRTEFESSTEHAELKDTVVARIERDKGISFRDFMAMALYEPGLGYYCTPGTKMGREGDYLTSPEVSPVFGVMVGRQLREMWEAMGSPARFDVVEAGAGNGTLCTDILGWARRRAPEFLDAANYTIIEPIPSLEAKQREGVTRHELDSRVQWRTEMRAAIEGCVLSNELLDSMPVHRVLIRGGDVFEIYVSWDGARFVEEFRGPGSEVRQYFERLGLLPGEGCRAEVNIEAPHWLHRVGAAIVRGFLLTFDYGYEAEELYAPWRKDGTLLCFYKHNPSGDPYSRIGRQDMTSHVDFTTLRRSGEQASPKTIGFVSQTEFLTNMGIAEAVPAARGEIGLEELLARRRAVSELIDPAGLGRIRVLAQAKGVERVRFRGFAADA